jgi:hypothetical protein
VSQATAIVAAASIDVVPDRETIAEAPAPIRAAWDEMIPLGNRYRSLRAARHALGFPQGNDRSIAFIEFENADRLWPDLHVANRNVALSSAFGQRTVSELQKGVQRGPAAKSVSPPPWPGPQPDLLIWIVLNAAAVWVPLPDDVEKAYAASLDRLRNREVPVSDVDPWKKVHVPKNQRAQGAVIVPEDLATR